MVDVMRSGRESAVFRSHREDNVSRRDTSVVVCSPGMTSWDSVVIISNRRAEELRGMLLIILASLVWT